MDESTIVWKEAKSRKHQAIATRGLSPDHDSTSDEDEIASSSRLEENRSDIDQENAIEGSDEWDESEDTYEDPLSTQPDVCTGRQDSASPSSVDEGAKKTFSHQRIDLKLRRNITDLANPSQHEPRSSTRDDQLPLDLWADSALIAISPNANIILFSNQCPENLVFLAKLRQEPVNQIDQYTTKTLNIPIDYDEHITSLLCLPVMSTQRTSLGSIDWTALIMGFSSGYVKFYTEESICLLSLKFCDEPVTSIKMQTQKTNSNARSSVHFAALVDELLITYKTCAIVTDGIGLYENLRVSRNEVVKSGLYKFEPAYTLTNLPIILTCQKWKFEGSKVIDAELLGTRCTSRFDALRSDSIDPGQIPTKNCTRALALIGSDSFVTCSREAKDNAAHSYTEIITSLLPFWAKPQPTKMQMNEISKSSDLILYDKGRRATSICSSPDKRLLALTDDYGRVMLIDVTNWIITRMWKGYRNAQCGWVEVKRNSEEKGTPYASFLVIYAPKRGLLEVWSAQRGPRVAAFNVGKHCRLIYSGFKMLNMRAETSIKDSIRPVGGFLIDQSYSTNCYLLNTKSETIFLIDLPYTYSLYKFGDLKSRDHLLIAELTNAINQDSDVSLISDILDRVALAESLEICIHKIAADEEPEKIIQIAENLIIKIMKNYDNDTGEAMTCDDVTIVDLCKRVIKLCTIFRELSAKQTQYMDLSLPEVNYRLIEQYEDHPKEVDEFAELLGWTPAEVLRYLSLLTLEQSFRVSSKTPSYLFGHAHLGEPLSWSDFISCFDLGRVQMKTDPQHKFADKLSIRLKDLSSSFLNQDKVLKTAIFMFVRLSRDYHILSMKSSMNFSQVSSDRLGDCYDYIEPSSRLALLVQFWLSTKLCNHWKMWHFLQNQMSRISEELKVAVKAKDGDDQLLIDCWRRIYELILESDNIFAGIVATTTIKSNTLRMINYRERQEKREKEATDQDQDEDDKLSQSAKDWECLCIDAERMALLSQQLVDVFLLSLLLNYSISDKQIIERAFVYRMPRISVASIIRGGPTTVSELIAQWVAQMRNDQIDLSIFTQDYGAINNVDDQITRVIIAAEEKHKSPNQTEWKFIPKAANFSGGGGGEDQVKELLHHVKTSFPYSLDRDVILLHCLWEFCQHWTNSSLQSNRKSLMLQRAIDALSLLSCPSLRHNAASLAFKTFFQRAFECLCLLIETNATMLSPKCSRTRDVLARRDLNMSEDCLEDFVRFCCNLSEFLLQTCRNEPELALNEQQQQRPRSSEDNEEVEKQGHEQEQLYDRLLCQDDWWSTPAAFIGLLNENNTNEYHFDSHQDASLGPISSNYFSATAKSTVAKTSLAAADLTTRMKQGMLLSSTGNNKSNSGSNNNNSGTILVRATLSSEKLFSPNVLLELNRLASLMDLVFKLKIIKSYPLTLIGEESRQILKLDLQQSTATGSDIQLRSGSLPELREKFSRRCIVSIVAKLTENLPSMASEFEDVDLEQASASAAPFEQLASRSNENTATSSNSLFTRHKRLGSNENQRSASVALVGGQQRSHVSAGGTGNDDGERHWATGEEDGDDDDGRGGNWNSTRDNELERKQANDECTLLFANLLSLANEWQLNCDELQLEFVFELFRCNHDKLAKQLMIRVQDKQMLGRGLLKICSQRVLVLFGLSARISSTNQWRQRVDKWSLFQPNISSWLKSVQREELEHELAELSFTTPGNELKPATVGRTNSIAGSSVQSHDDKGSDNESNYSEAAAADSQDEAFLAHMERALGLRMFVLQALHWKTKSVLELITNYLDGQASRLAYDLLRVLETRLFERQFLPSERELWLKQLAESKSQVLTSKCMRVIMLLLTLAGVTSLQAQHAGNMNSIASARPAENLTTTNFALTSMPAGTADVLDGGSISKRYREIMSNGATSSTEASVAESRVDSGRISQPPNQVDAHVGSPQPMANSTPSALVTTTTLTTNAMSPLDRATALDGQATRAPVELQQRARVGSGTNATTPATTLSESALNNISTASKQHNDQMNTIVVTNAASGNTNDDKVRATTSKALTAKAQQIARAKKFRCSSNEQCNNGALCHNGVCFCLPGFTGDTCQTDIDECRQFGGNGLPGEQLPCLNGGMCIDEINAFRCQCAPGYQGERCQDEVDMCSDLPCKNGAKCLNYRTHYECQCLTGWTGNQCETNIDECASRPCQNNGTCRDLIADFVCDCAPGWTGKQCQLNIDDCAQKPCNENSTLACIDLVNDYSCKCAPGYSGKNCQIDINECSGEPCANNGQCIDLINGYKCLCSLGWTGDQCELDVNECDSSIPVCHNGGMCENLEPSFKCHCRDGWTGRNCLDIADYCKAKKPCGKFGTCINTNSSSFQCECQSGYIGTRCETRRNCHNECHQEHGHCVANSTSCVCQPAVEGEPDRKACELISSCEQAPGVLCLNGGSCRSLPAGAGYECDCAPDFHGPICQYMDNKSQLDLALIIAICGVCCLMVACLIVALLMFRSVRKARATRGTYSPSTQEKFESNSALGGGDMLKPPIPERLI